MDQLINFILFFILVDIKYVVLEPCGGYCSRILEPFNYFQTFSNGIRTIILDERLSSMICPLPDFQNLLFECSSIDACHCNETLELYGRCYGGDTTFCSVLANANNNTFAHTCQEELHRVCLGYTFPTLKPTTTQKMTSLLPTKHHVDSNSSHTISTSSWAPSSNKPILNKPPITSTDQDEVKTAVTTVFTVGVIGVAIASLSLVLFKRNRKRTEQYNVVKQEQPTTNLNQTPRMTCANGATFQGYDSKPSDSDVVCTVEINMHNPNDKT